MSYFKIRAFSLFLLFFVKIALYFISRIDNQYIRINIVAAEENKYCRSGSEKQWGTSYFVFYLNYISGNSVSNFKFIQRICGFNLFFDRLLLQKNLFLRKKKGQSALVSHFTFNLKILRISLNEFIKWMSWFYFQRIVSSMFSAVSLARHWRN